MFISSFIGDARVRASRNVGAGHARPPDADPAHRRMIVACVEHPTIQKGIGDRIEEVPGDLILSMLKQSIISIHIATSSIFLSEMFPRTRSGE